MRLKNVGPDLFFAVRGMSRYGVETPALQEVDNAVSLVPSHVSLLANDGNTLSLPAAAKLTDADHYVVLTLQGSAVRSVKAKTIHNNQLNIASLPNGMYSLQVWGT